MSESDSVAAHPKKPKMFDIVIIGGGIAGVTCCEQLIRIHAERQCHKSVALISAHPLLKGVRRTQKVSQCLMDIEVAEYSSKEFRARCGGKDDDEEQYTALSVVIGTVTNIDGIERVITFQAVDDSDSVPIHFQFAQCLIASGGSPRRFKVKEAQCRGLIHVLRDSETVHHFSETMSSANCQTLMVVGNGGISMEIVYALLAHRRTDGNPLHIIWVIKHRHIGNTFLDEASSAFLIPQLFPKEDPQRNKGRIIDHKPLDDVESLSVAADHNLGGAVGPRWTQNVSRFAEQTPLWMEHTEVATDGEDQEMQNEDDDDGSEQKEEEQFPNELTLKMECDVSTLIEVEDPDDGQYRIEVLLTNGERIKVDHLLCALGVTPNTAFCDDAVFKKTDTGELVVDQYLETNVEGIFAAGDAAHIELDDDHDDSAWFQMKLWSHSQTTGWIAAHAMSCENAEEKEDDIELQFNFEIFGHVTKFFGQKCVFLGRFNAEKEEDESIRIMLRVKPNEEFVKVVVQKERVIGAVLIGDTDLEETMENLILNKIDISCYGDDFLKYDVDLEAMFD